MIFTKEETKNLINMLRSADADNALIAFKSIANVDTKKYIGELIVLYKYGSQTINTWEKECPQVALAIKNALKLYISNDISNITTGSCLSALFAARASSQSLELFVEYFTEGVVKSLEQMGFPVEKFDINIKLKENEQATILK